MIGDLTRNFNSFIMILLLCSCCKTSQEQGSVLPEWEAKIPTGSSNEIYYDGLPNMPLYKDWLVAHTTLVDMEFKEDNRLCAINRKTGAIDWYFPPDVSERRYCFFDGKCYQYNNKLVFQYVKDNSKNFHYSAVCLDLDSQIILWEVDDISDGFAKDVIGRSQYCYFVMNYDEIYQGELNNDTVMSIYKPVDSSRRINDISIIDDDKLLIFESAETESVDYDYYGSHKKIINYAIIYNTSTMNIIYTHEIVFPNNSYAYQCSAEGFEKNGVIYANLDRCLTAIEIASDSQLWERDDYWAYTLMDMYVYKDVILKCGGNATIGYDKNTGDIIYDYRNYGTWHTTVDDKYAYLLTCKNVIDILDIESGEKLDRIVCPDKSSGFFGSYPMIYDSKLYVMGGKNSLYRYPTYPWK